MAIYYDEVISGKGKSLTILNGDSAYNTIVRNSAALRVSAGGYVESTTVYNSAVLSNTGYAMSTLLSGGTMTLSSGGTAHTLSVLRGGRLNVSIGGVATDVCIASATVIIATVKGGDSVTRIEGSYENGSAFSLSNGVASNFLFNSLGQLTVLSGGSAKDIVINNAGTLTVSNGGVATGIIQNSGGKLNTTIRGGDSQTYVAGSNVSGTFLLSGGTASDFILYENAAQHISNGGVAMRTTVINNWAHQFVYSGGTALETKVSNKGSMTIYAGGVVRDALIYSGGSMILTGGDVRGTTVYGVLLVSAATVGPDESGGVAALNDLEVMPGGVLDLNVNKVTISGTVNIRGEVTTVSGITVNVSPGTELYNFTVGAGALVNASSGTTLTDLSAASGALVNASSGTTLTDLSAASGAQVRIATGAVLAGTKLDIAENTIYYSGTALGMTAAYGRVSELGADGKAYDLAFGSGVTVAGAHIVSGGQLNALSGAVLEDTVIRSGGSLVLNSGAETGKRLFFDFSNASSGGNMTGMVNDLDLISSETAICLTGLTAGGVYNVISGADIHIYSDPSDTVNITLAEGESGTDVFGGMTYAFDGEKVTAEALAEPVVVLSSYASLNDSATEIGDDLAAVWANFTETGALTAVDSDFGGNAWLELDGTNLSGAQLYGVASGEYMNGVVNLMLTSGAVIGNLAAGAGAWGAVGGVNLTIDAATLEGASYAGGFGNVAYFDDEHGGDWTFGNVTTHIKSGTFNKDFYAGALANYKSTGEGSETDVGDVTLTVDSGTFHGNLYGASSVKVNDPEAGNIHSVNDVFITLNGGETPEGKQFCLFSGGYATGTGGQVYSVNSVDLTINGGQWGMRQGGRGIFGGIMASGVAATVGDVNILVTGGDVGNIYGGGWAQRNGSSTVGDVNITVTGGKLSHILGGGSHSTSGGETLVDGDVNIVISGGDIDGDIYARGHVAGDSVIGDVSVTFTGAQDFDCGVYGYTYVGGVASNAILSCTDYTGEFAGAIGGFTNIVLEGSTAMTLTTAAENVSNRKWNFDVTERDTAFTGTAMLNWSAADFTVSENTVITLNLAVGDTNEWSLVDAAADTNYSKFDVLVDGASILADTIALDEQIADGDYAGWGFALEDTVLKFKNLAQV